MDGSATRCAVRAVGSPREGGVALFLMLVAEFGLVFWIRGLSIKEYFSTRDPVSGAAYYLLLIVFAIMPFLAEMTMLHSYRKGFRRGRAACVRARPRGRSSNREGTWSTARLEIGAQAGGKIPEAGEATQGGRKRACEVVTNLKSD